MSFRKFILLAILIVSAAGASAQDIIVGADFATRFDNREYASNTFDNSQTLFSARLTPYAGVQWQEKNRLVLGVEMMQNFGQHNGNREPFLSDVKPLMYYQFRTKNVQANAGIFNRAELMGDYSDAFISDSTAFYHNRLSGFLGRYESTSHRKTYAEMAIDWEGMYDTDTREMFRIYSAGRYTFDRGLYVGYAFTMFHFAGCKDNENVTDNLLVNPYVGWEFSAYFDFDIKAGFLMAPQRARSIVPGWTKPCGGRIDFSMTKWGVKIENNLYIGENLQPYLNVVSNPATGQTFDNEHLYAGERFYSTTEHVYNRTWIGYNRSFFNNSVTVDAGMIFKNDGTGTGTQQMVKLSINFERLIKVGKKHKE